VSAQFDTLVGDDRHRVHKAMRDLRSRGLSYRAIAGALDVFEGLALSTEQVRKRMSYLGEPKDDRKARAPRVTP
jgi:hypothetical protein